MTASKCDQILVCLLGRAEPLAQVRNSALLEGDYRSHGDEEYARSS